MSDSYIQHSKGGTAFVGEDAVRLMAALTLRSGLDLLAKHIRPAKGWTITGALGSASRYTGKSYKRNEIDKAIADLTIWIETMRAGLEVRND